MAVSPPLRGNLGRTLLLACLLLALVPLLGISALTTWRQYQQSREQIIQQLTSVVRLKEADVRTWFRSLTPNLELLAADPRIQHGLAASATTTADETSQALQGALRASDTFHELILLDLDGRVLASTNASRAGQTYATQPFVQAGARAPYVQTPFYSLAYDQMVVFAAAPVRDDEGVARGILAGVTTLDTLDEIMRERAGLGDTGETYLVSSDHIMLTEPRAAPPRAKPFGAVRTHGANQALGQIDGSGLYDNYEYPPVPVVGVYRWIPELRVALLAEQSQAEAFATAWQNIWLTLGVTMLTALITVLAAVAITRSIARPLAQLTSGAARVAHGDLTPMAPIARDDEIGVLAAAFNTMTAQVRELIESLEARVAARTVELEAQKEALRRSEQKLSLHMQQTSFAAIEWGLDHEIIEWNPAAEKIFGYSRAEAVGNCMELIVPDSARDGVISVHNDLLNSRESRRTTNENITKDGRIILCEWYNTPLIDQNGAVIGVASLAQDITERQRAQETMLHRQKLESLGVLAGGIAHDFNNLLMGVLGNAELARYDLPDDSPALDSIWQIELAARRAADLTRQMLDYSGKGQFVVQLVDLNAIVKEIPQLLQVSIAKGVRLTYNFGRQLPAIQADAAQIRQVVMNLVINASEAIGEAGGEITITTGTIQVSQSYLANTYLAPDLGAGEYVFLEVSDTGCGMDTTTQAKIFEPFFTTKFTGRGLGLAALLGIVRGHGGALKVNSAPGKGTTFLILLPSAGAPAAAADTAAPPLPLPYPRETVLVVDDEESVREVTARALKRLGFSVLLAQNGQQGIDLYCAQADSIGCVLLDLTMPLIGGEQVFHEIRRLRPGAQIVLMSGYSREDVASRLDFQGPTRFLQKPFTSAELREALQEVLKVA